MENYLNYTEVDASSDITIGESRIDYNTMVTSVVSYVYRDRGPTNLIGNFEYLVTVAVTTSNTGSSVELFAVANSVGARATRFAAGDGIGVITVQTTGSVSAITLYDAETGNTDFFSGSAGFTYYLTISRSGTTATCAIYDDFERTILVDTLSITCSADTYRYIYALSSTAAASPSQKTGFVEHLDLQGSRLSAAGRVTASFNLSANPRALATQTRNTV